MPAEVTVSSLWAQDADLEERIKEQDHARRHVRGVRLWLLALSTLGVVYGDIGTSPLYVYGAVFPNGAPADANVVYGVFSTIFWTITSIVLVKYIIFTLAADDNGEGGIFALYALICRAANIRNGARVHEADVSLSQYRHGRPAGAGGSRVAARLRGALEHNKTLQTVLLVVVLLASNMVISDGVLTPAISVVSAIEGIQFQTGISTGAVIGISMGILVALFALQSFGTQKVSFLFSPLMLLWFVCNAVLGIYNITRFGPGVFKALSPHYMYYLWSGNAPQAWRDLGNIMLCVTGAEALYADIGHFNVMSIRLSFLTVAYPSLILTYLGQTAMIVDDPSTSTAAYWHSVPHSVLWPMVVLATLAAIIASQALITGAFSIVQQAMAMNAFPRLTVRHTSDHIMGQVYIPEINWLLMVGALLVVGVFQTSAKIGNAYGLAVIIVMTLDTSLLSIVMLTAWDWSPTLVAAFWLVFTFITSAYLSSNASKVPKGAWFSLALSAILSCITYLWHWGQHKKLKYVKDNKILLRELYEEDPASAALLASKPRAFDVEASDAGSKYGLSRPSAASTMSTRDSLSAGGAHPMQSLRLVDSKLPVSRVPGIGIYYNELLLGVPPVLERFMSLVPALHEVVIFLTVRIVPVPYVLPAERMLIRRLRFDGFYHAVARYGYLDRIDHGPLFVDAVVEEIHEYLHPATGIHDLAAGARSAGGSMHGGQQLADLEKGRGAESHEGSVHRGRVVHVDPSESLSTASGRHLGDRLAVQLVNLARHSGARSAAGKEGGTAYLSPSRRRFGDALRPRISSSITLAMPMADEEASGQEGSSGAELPGMAAAAPWVQMPSQVRRVRAQLLGQLPEGRPAGASTAGHRGRGDSAAEQANQRSLPLPAQQQRAQLLALRDPTRSLPLRQGTLVRRVPLYRMQQAMAAAAAAGTDEGEQVPPSGSVSARGASAAAVAPSVAGSEASRPVTGHPAGNIYQMTPTATLAPAAAAALGQQLWHRLQMGRLQGLFRASGDPRQGRPGSVAENSTQADTEQGAYATSAPTHGRADSVCTENLLAAGGAGMNAEDARRHLFQMQNVPFGIAESQQADYYAAERQLLLDAKQRGVVYLVGRSDLRAEPGSSWLKTFLLESAYGTLAANCRPTTRMYKVPQQGLLSMGVDYEL